MKKLVFLLLLGAVAVTIHAQPPAFDLPAFNQERYHVNKTAFVVLGSWSAASIITGIAGQANSSGRARYFHQMNIIWGSVNLLIALPGYISARKSRPDLTLAASLKGQAATEKTFIFNAGLDLAYLAAGAWLLEKGNTGSHTDRYKGYGNSVLLQGAALLLFDAVLFITHHQHGKKIYRALESLQLAPNGVGLNIGI